MKWVKIRYLQPCPPTRGLWHHGEEEFKSTPHCTSHRECLRCLPVQHFALALSFSQPSCTSALSIFTQQPRPGWLQKHGRYRIIGKKGPARGLLGEVSCTLNNKLCTRRLGYDTRLAGTCILRLPWPHCPCSAAAPKEEQIQSQLVNAWEKTWLTGVSLEALLPLFNYSGVSTTMLRRKKWRARSKYLRQMTGIHGQITRDLQRGVFYPRAGDSTSGQILFLTSNRFFDSKVDIYT